VLMNDGSAMSKGAPDRRCSRPRPKPSQHRPGVGSARAGKHVETAADTEAIRLRYTNTDHKTRAKCDRSRSILSQRIDDRTVG